MFKTLLKLRLTAFLSITFRRLSKGRKRSAGMKLLIGIFILYMLASVMFMLATMFDQISVFLSIPGFEWMYFAFFGITGFAVCFVGSIFTVESQLFEASDNEMLLSMPIKPWMIIASRMTELILINLAFTVIIAVPVSAVCFMKIGFTLQRLLYIIAGVILYPFLSLSVSCIVGWLVGMISAKTRAKNLIHTILALVFLLAYMYICFSANKLMTRLIIQGETIAAAIRSSLPPVYYFGKALGSCDIEALLITAAFCLIPFAIILCLLSRGFFRIASSGRSTAKKGLQGMSTRFNKKQSSPRSALIRKELGRFFNLPIYLLNYGLSSVFMLIISAAMIIKGKDILVSLGFIQVISGAQTGAFIAPALCLVLGFLIAMCCPSSVSVSLEGSRLWILKSSPVKTADIFIAKIFTNLVISVPFIIITVTTAWAVFSLAAATGILILLLALAMQMFSAVFGLCVNLCLPRLSWISESAVIKQSGSSIISIFGAIAIMVIPVIIYFAAGRYLSFDAFLVICFAFYLLLTLTALLWLKSIGKRKYETM